jgi:hypothetical protein
VGVGVEDDVSTELVSAAAAWNTPPGSCDDDSAEVLGTTAAAMATLGALLPTAGAGPYWISTPPGSELPITPATFSLARLEGVAILHARCWSWLRIVKRGQSSTIPEGLVHWLTAAWRNPESQPLMKSPW